MVARPVPDDSPPHDLDALWRATRERLKSSVPESTYRLWLEPLEAIGSEGDTLYLTGPESVRAWSERRYSSLIAEALREAGGELERVSFAELEPSGTGGRRKRGWSGPTAPFRRAP